MRLQYTCIDSWAPLAWFATCRRDRDIAEVRHGSQVETYPRWFCEAAWPGPFEKGGFDETDLVAGTGGRLRDDTVLFVSPGNTIDRTVFLETPEGLLVSNSLPCLLAMSGAQIDPTYPRYYEDFSTAIAGLKRYKTTLSTSRGEIRLGMNGYVRWDGRCAKSLLRETVRRDFSSFGSYVEFLRTSLSELSLNIADARRKSAYRLLATTSGGYDSTAVSALAREAGCLDTICIDGDRSGAPEDGAQVARQLGLMPTAVARDAWRAADAPEMLFIAADGTAEAVPLAGAETELANRVLLTGYHGDKVWAKDADDLSEDLVRGDSSGLSLSEYRLWTGFIHCPITFWGARQIADLNRLSNSPEMRPWDVPGDYSRPIPRRIVESAGVSRGSFGIEKHASAVAFREFLSTSSMARYVAWLRASRGQWLRRGKAPPIPSVRYERCTTTVADAIEGILHKTPLLWKIAPDNALDRPRGFRRHAFAWAVAEIARRYRC